jgi:hypothetical protein
MKVIHVLRKPCSESTVAANVVRHGTGGLNIDASRIAWANPKDLEGVQSKVESLAKYMGEGRVVQSKSIGRESRIGPDALTPPHASGRWPANLILQHPQGCSKEAGVCISDCSVAMLKVQGVPKSEVRHRGDSEDTSAAVRYFKQSYWKG